jgi:putative endonuclease
MERCGYTYIMSSPTGTLYTGVTSRLEFRVWQHKTGEFEGFSHRYGCTRLVHYEAFDQISAAIDREKQIKGWLRAKKIALIEKHNPQWRDLAEHWGEKMPMGSGRK